jgi:hypothetical protein
MWRLVQVEGIEPTNNSAERALRRAVMWKRKSFGAQSETGSRFVERILTVMMNLRQQGRDVLEGLVALCSHQPLSLLPDVHLFLFILSPHQNGYEPLDLSLITSLKHGSQ